MSEATSAVIGAGIVSFLPGIDAAQKDKVKLALAMAERATDTAYKEGLIKDWFAYYRNQLKFMGWDAVTAEQIHWPDKTRTQQTDQLLQTLSKTAGDSFATSVKVSIQTLLKKPSVLKELETKAFERQHFQVLACARLATTGLIWWFTTKRTNSLFSVQGSSAASAVTRMCVRNWYGSIFWPLRTAYCQKSRKASSRCPRRAFMTMPSKAPDTL